MSYEPKTSRGRAAQAAREVEAWNRLHPVGVTVRYWRGLREGEGAISRTRSAAWVVCDHAAVLIEGTSGSIALSHVEPLPGLKLEDAQAQDYRARHHPRLF